MQNPKYPDSLWWEIIAYHKKTGMVAKGLHERFGPSESFIYKILRKGAPPGPKGSRDSYTPEQRLARFWTFVDKTDSCWLFTGGQNVHGYGCFFNDDHKLVGAHVYAYKTLKGPTNGLFVLHTCDNRLCVRPEHLTLGTHKDNMADMVRKGRSARGERCGSSKYSDALITEMIEYHRATGASLRVLSRKFGPSYTYVSKILKGYARINQQPVAESGIVAEPEGLSS